MTDVTVEASEGTGVIVDARAYWLAQYFRGNAVYAAESSSRVISRLNHIQDMLRVCPCKE